jgi:hypothetical protein
MRNPTTGDLESEHERVSFLIKLADLYLKPETLKAKYQTLKQPNTKQPNSQRLG